METIIGKEFPKKVIPLIDNAKQSIDVIIFDWRWYPQNIGCSAQLFNQAIVRAKRRGVKIKVLANSDDIIKILKEIGCEAKKIISKRLLHCKIMIIDDEIAITGSHNYTQSAFEMNYELSVILKDRENIDDIIKFFKQIYG